MDPAPPPPPQAPAAPPPQALDDPLSKLKQAVRERVPCDLGGIDALHADEDAWAGREIDASAVSEQIRQASTDGLQFELNGAHIRGRLSLRDRNTELTSSLRLTSCWIDGGLDLNFATLSELSVKGSVLGTTTAGWAGWGLSGHFVTVSGDMCLDAARVSGGCELDGAMIKGSFDAPGVEIFGHYGAHPDTESRWAIDLTNATMAGDLLLKCSALHGGLCLAGATVTGQVNLSGADMSAPGRTTASTGRGGRISEYAAVWAQGCHVGASVLAIPSALDQGTEKPTIFTGYVAFVSAKIDRQAYFTGADFRALAGPVPQKPTSMNFGNDREEIGLDLFNCKIGGCLNLEKAKCPGRQVDLRDCDTERFTPGETLWNAGWYGVFGLKYRTVTARKKAWWWNKERTVKAAEKTRWWNKERSVTGTGKARRDWIKEAVDGKKPGPYLTLAAAAHNDGEPVDERKARICASSAAANAVERVGLGWVRYGYRPYFVVGPLLVFGVVAYLLVASARPNGFAPVIVANTSYTPTQCDNAKLNCLNPTLYAIDSVIPIDLHQVSTWRPNRSTAAGDALYWDVTFNRVVAWLIDGVFLAAVAGFLKRT